MSWILKSSQNKAAFFLELQNVLKLLLRKKSLCKRDAGFVKNAMLSGPSIDHKRKVLLHDES